MTFMKTTRRVAMGLVAAVAASFATGASAGGHGIDLTGKTVEWVIPFSETGGSAKWANFYAPLLSEALPGNPTVVVKFMPGAGSTKGANWFQQQKYEDSQGTLIFGSSGSTQFPYLLGDRGCAMSMATGTWCWHRAPAAWPTCHPDLAGQMNGLDASALQGTDFIYGSQGATRLDLVPLLAWEMLGLSVEPVFGIKGRGDGRLMFERGEANIDYQTSSSYLKGVTPLVEAGTAVPMMSWGALDAAGNIVRDPTFPDMPTFKEVCEATPMAARPRARSGTPGRPSSSRASRRRRWSFCPRAPAVTRSLPTPRPLRRSRSAPTSPRSPRAAWASTRR